MERAAQAVQEVAAGASGEAREDSAARRRAVQKRIIPDGVERRPVDRDGNCVFTSIAEGVAAIRNKPKAMSASGAPRRRHEAVLQFPAGEAVARFAGVHGGSQSKANARHQGGQAGASWKD